MPPTVSKNRPLVHAHEGAWTGITTSHPDVHTQDCIQRTCAKMRVYFPRCAHPGTPHLQKRTKIPKRVHTHRHLHPQMGTQDTSTLAVCIHVHPLPARYSSLYSPKMCPTQGLAAATENRKPKGARKRWVKGPSGENKLGRAHGPPVHPPSALTVDAGLVRHGSAFSLPVPSERSTWSWPSSTRLDLDLQRMWRRL